MSTIGNDILEQLNDDLVSHGWLVQCVNEDSAGTKSQTWKDVLEELLRGDVEIGETRNPSGDYLEFIAWTGTVAERVDRAIKSVANAVAADADFSYWLSLRRNVDRYEETNI